MRKQPLPLVDPARSEFGFARTCCDCPKCVWNCSHVPGYLVPPDLERLHEHLGAERDLLSWAKEHLLASPGAVVMQGGQMFRIPTLVPARGPEGACIFFMDGRCAIHAVAPYGCAFFDMHQPFSEADRRSKRGLHEILAAWHRHDGYAQVWLALAAAGLTAPAPELARREPDRADKGRPPGGAGTS